LTDEACSAESSSGSVSEVLAVNASDSHAPVCHLSLEARRWPLGHSRLADGFGSSDIRLSEGACLFVLETSRHASQRGVRPLAIVTGWDGPPDRAVGEGVCTSVAGLLKPGAICIERWIGRCIGASGACAIAAAIGAGKGCVVPIVDSSDPPSVTIASLPPSTVPDGRGAVSVTVQASGVEGGCSTLELSIPVAD